jgi:hypothetical protein
MRILANYLVGFSYSDDEEYIPTPAQLAGSAVVERYLRGEQVFTSARPYRVALFSFSALGR